MAKNIKARIQLQLPGGSITPAGKVGQSLGQHGVSIMDFCKQFNAATAKRKGETVPVVITIFADRSFEFITKTAPTAELILKKVGIKKGAGNVGTDVVGKIAWKDVEEIAMIKMPDLNAFDIEAAKKIVAGSARSMGVEVVD